MASQMSPDSARADRRFVRRAMSEAMLSAEAELDLAQRWRGAGDEAALHELTSAYMRLVIALAGRFRHYGLAMADLVQEGNVGLMQAAARFEPERGVRFSTYASWWIRSSIQDFVLRNWSIVRTGTTAAQKSLFFNLRRLRARIGDLGEASISPQARAFVAGELRVEEREVDQMAARIAGADSSLNVPVGEEGEIERLDLLADERPSPEDEVMAGRDAAARAAWLKAALAELKPREQFILAERRLVEEPQTLEALGLRLGISKERVRQLEQQALVKLRRLLEKRREQLLS